MIIDELNSQGVRTKRGNTFGKNSIHDILKNEKYTGTYIFNKTEKKINGKRNHHKLKSVDEIIRIPDGMPQIISKEKWERVKLKMKDNQHASGAYTAKELYMLSGLIYCDKCGGAMTGKRRHAGRNKDLYLTYECSTRKRKRTCDMKGVNKGYVEQMVIDGLYNDIFETNAMNDLVDNLQDYSKSQSLTVNDDIKVFERELSKVKFEINNIVNAIAGGMFHESMKVKMDTLESRKASLEVKIHEAKFQSGLYSFSRDEMINYFKKDADIKEKSPEEQKQVIQTYIKKITVFDDSIIIDNIVTLNGGGEGNRTPVRKHIHKTFYECSHCFDFAAVTPQ